MKEKIEIIIIEALEALGVASPRVALERSADSAHGDYATNSALVYGKMTGVPARHCLSLKGSSRAMAGGSPREFAGKLVEKILETPSEEIAKIEIAGPGFINFFLTDTALETAVFSIPKPGLESADSCLGHGIIRNPGLGMRQGERVNIEFISTNPTGELHIGHGRSAFFGDTLSRVLARAGNNVTREFYINDSRESNQIRELGNTALGKGEQYKTPELEEKMRALDFAGFSEEEAGVKLATAVQASNRTFVEEGLGVHFDTWYSEDAELRASGASAEMFARLKGQGFTYEKDGAVWLKTSEYGDDEDRVIVRSDGTLPYFLSDIAYHDKKFARGFGTVIDVWGADHHGHVKRMQAVGRMLGWPKTLLNADQPIVFIAQLVSLKEDGVSSKMSKRAGNVILLRDLVAEFGIDIVRWFFNEKALSTQMTFDMALAREQSEKNPVFYVQYAHARIASIAEKARGVKEGRATEFTDLIKTPSARALASKITELPEVIDYISREYAVQALTNYATALATSANAFYRDVHIVNDDGIDTGALALAIRAKETLADTLSLLGISAPNKM